MMSYRSSAVNDDDRPRSSRRMRGTRTRDIENESSSNGNNNSESDGRMVSGLDVQKVKQSTDLATVLDIPSSRKSHNSLGRSRSKSPAFRRKSALIESMAANFERKSTDKTLPSVSRNVPNGDIKPNHTPSITTPVSPPDIDDNDTSAHKKSGPSARRGKLQREKRMLRQKRRSTGVVNLKDVEGDNSEEKTESKEEKVESETAINTQSNELSPTQGCFPVPRTTAKSSDSYSSVQTADVNGSYQETTSSIMVLSHMSSSRRYGNKSKEPPVSSNVSDVGDLKTKLQVAEQTIEKLRQEVRNLDDDLRVLEEENKKLKNENKLLEDENTTMLRLIRRP